MKTNYILIDFENVQPDNLSLLHGHDMQLIVFVGAKQKNVPMTFAVAMQALGDKACYQQASGTGRNALDFHLAFYMGEISGTQRDVFFHFISRDKGFDPLIAHLRERKIFASRHEDLADIPFVKMTRVMSMDEKIDMISERLRGFGTSRPRTVTTLLSTVNAIFHKDLDEGTRNALVAEMQKRQKISFSDQKVLYAPCITGQ